MPVPSVAVTVRMSLGRARQRGRGQQLEGRRGGVGAGREADGRALAVIVELPAAPGQRAGHVLQP